jgi:hypothetical protein
MADELTKEQIKENKKKAEWEKLFTSHLLARRYPNVYINRNIPSSVIVTQIPADELHHSARLESEAIHHIQSHSGDIAQLWDGAYPFLKRYPACCVNTSGADKYMRSGKNTGALEDILQDGDAFKTMIEKKDGDGFKLESTSVFWRVTTDEFDMLNGYFLIIDQFEKRAKESGIFETTRLKLDYFSSSYVLLQAPKSFGDRLRIPYEPGFTGPNVKGFCSRVSDAYVDVDWMSVGAIVRIRTRLMSSIATCTSILPACFWYRLKKKD